MTSKKILVYKLLIFIILSGCILNNKPNTSTIPSTTATLQVVNLPSLSTTGYSSASTMTSLTNTTLPAMTQIPTLPTNDAFVLLQEFLKNDVPCQLPCWGGITPGVSTLSDVQNLLTTFSSVSSWTYFGKGGGSSFIGNLEIDYPLDDTVINIWTAYLAPSESEAILNIVIDTQSLPENQKADFYGNESYNTLLSAYTLAQIMSTYGLPAQIFFSADINEAEPTAPDFFIVRLLYPDLGIFVKYTMPVETKQKTYGFCASDSIIYLDLLPQGFGENYKDFFKQIGDNQWNPTLPMLPFYKSVEESLEITNEEFYTLIISSPETCFESPKDIWPKP